MYAVFALQTTAQLALGPPSLPTSHGCAGTVGAQPSSGSLEGLRDDLHQARQAVRRLAGSPYEIVRPLGRGGMGAVYLAFHRPTRRFVALKMLTRIGKRDNQYLSRFRREAAAAGSVTHVHVVRALEAEQAAGFCYLALEYLDGLDLARLVGRLGKLSIADACAIVRQAALGLQELHDCGIVHRDIKPSNLMLTRDGVVKVVDLGLALLNEHGPAHDDLADSEQCVGSLDYIAPEQAQDSRTVSRAVDLYGLGATLFHLLSGVPPFAGKAFSSPVTKLLAIADCAAPRLQERRASVPAELAAIVARLLAKNPAERFDSAAGLAAALEPFVGGNNLVDLVLRADARSFEHDFPIGAPCDDSSHCHAETIDYLR
jgi:serine/threonine protein kinase